MFQQESPADSTSSTGAGDEDAELMMDELLATPPLSSTARGFPPRRRLEPLPEEEDTDSPTPTPGPTAQKEMPSPEQVSHSRQGVDCFCLAMHVIHCVCLFVCFYAGSLTGVHKVPTAVLYTHIHTCAVVTDCMTALVVVVQK